MPTYVCGVDIESGAMEPGTTQIELNSRNIPAELKAWMVRYSNVSGMSINAVIRLALVGWLTQFGSFARPDLADSPDRIFTHSPSQEG